jgi:hypothetical protein
VETPAIGFHDEQVITLDYKSLYPSIMVTFSMCLKTLVPGRQLDERRRQYALQEDDVWMPHTKALDGEMEDQPIFVRSAHTKGLVTEILQALLAQRKRFKRLMKAAYDRGDKAMGGIYNMRQLVTKLQCNSIYGVFGAPSSFAYCPEIAAMVTAYGREMILETKAIVEKLFNIAAGFPFDARVTYGDSVVGDTAIVIRRSPDSACVEVVRFDDLFDEYAAAAADNVVEERDKQLVYDVSCGGSVHLPLVRDEHGFTQMRRLIRHRCNKPIVRVLTHTGVVDCTTDHSLVGADGVEISPSHVSVGTRLLHTGETLDEKNFVGNGDEVTSVNEAYVMGVFLADGTAGVYGTHHTWLIRKKDRSLLERVSERAPFRTSRIYDMLESSKGYGLAPAGSYRELVVRYRSMFYNRHGEKRVPRQILNAKKDVLQAFMEGFYDGDGDKADNSTRGRFDQRGKQVAEGLWLVCSRLGWSMSLNDRNDKPDIFRITLSRADPGAPHVKRRRRDLHAVKKDARYFSAHEDEYAFVYDIETDSHHFHVGPGNLVVHNTVTSSNRKNRKNLFAKFAT